MTYKNELTDLLATIGAEVYATPVDEKDVIVCLARLRPMTEDDRKLVMAERRALMFIEEALVKSNADDSWNLRFSRPWVLKNDKLAYTWDFTIKGDIEAALKALSTIKLMKAPVTKEEDVAVQHVKPKRGRIKPVSIGAIR